MTNELERQFFKCFGIEPKLVISLEDWESCKDLPRAEELFKHYPQITDHILLELMCIKNKELISLVQVKGNNLEELKSYVLRTCIKGYTKYSSSSLSSHKEIADNFKHHVRTLFEEG